ncbi:MAG: Xaa-Pro peptidase family protein [Actinomycetes bacterium]
MDNDVFTNRIDRARAITRAVEIDALLVTPGPNLRYLTGYDAIPLERLTCLVLRADADPVLVAPLLEVPAALVSPVGQLGFEVTGWNETDDPFALVASMLPSAGVVALDDLMVASKVLHLREAMPAVEQTLAGRVLRDLRMRKDAHEIAALAEAGAAIDRVHARVPDYLRAGRTEHEVGRDIAAAIVDEGHETVDFVIVASGPNGASPHHELSDRVIEVGDPVVVDIGGTMPSGYCSDSTRTYSVGEPPEDFLAYYAVLQQAQQAAVALVRPGVAAESIDAAARTPITAAGYGDLFIHRIGHGIGLETHEDPYIVSGNTEAVDVGMAFSVEPGIYVEGRHGARIEDIVVVTDDGVRPLNLQPRDLVVVG